MVWEIIFITAIFLFGFWNLTIAILGLFPKFRSTAIGTLTKTVTQRNVQVRYGKIPYLTRYTYTYTVGGKKYRYTGQVQKHKRSLFPKVSMVFVKWFPRHAYPNKFNGSYEWAWGLTMIFLGILFVKVMIFA